MTEGRLVHEALSYKINGVLFDVSNELGPGLRERAYQRAVASGLNRCGLTYKEQVYFPIHYHEVIVGSGYLDFLVEDLVVVELKVGEHFARQHIDQALQYLRMTKLQLAILANFTRQGVKLRRIVNIHKEAERKNP